jgi:hypothetical protein
MENSLNGKDLEAKVSYGFVFDGYIGDFFKLRKYVEEEVKNSRVVFSQFGKNAYFLVNWNDLSPEKQLRIKKEKEKKKA